MRRWGPTGMLVRVALRPLELTMGLEVRLQLRASFSQVRVALATSNAASHELQVSLAVTPAEVAEVMTEIKRINPRFCSRPENLDLVVLGLAPRETARNKAVGYWCFRLEGDDLHDMGLAVVPQWRGRGVAGALLVSALEAMKADTGTLWVSVDPFNRAARRVMQRAGLKHTALDIWWSLPANPRRPRRLRLSL